MAPPASPSASPPAGSPPSSQKAFLEIEDGPRLPCLFNPGAAPAHGRGTLGRPTPCPAVASRGFGYTGAHSGQLRLHLVFDTTDTGKAVTAHTNRLLNAMKVDPNLPGHDPTRNRGRPPWVKFHWGDLHSFKAVIENLDLTFTYFSASGTPLRAKASLSLKQFEEDAKWGPQNPTSGTPEPHRVHQFELGDSLDRLSARYYGDSTQWRLIARANAIADPLALRPGSMLTIPKLDS